MIDQDNIDGLNHWALLRLAIADMKCRNYLNKLSVRTNNDRLQVQSDLLEASSVSLSHDCGRAGARQRDRYGQEEMDVVGGTNGLPQSQCTNVHVDFCAVHRVATARRMCTKKSSCRSFHSFLINSHCCFPDSRLTVVVTSHARDFARRQAQRSALDASTARAAGINRVFLLAVDPEVDQALIEQENLDHRDLVQGNFPESYHNLVYKHLMGLYWATTYCHNNR